LFINYFKVFGSQEKWVNVAILPLCCCKTSKDVSLLIPIAAWQCFVLDFECPCRASGGWREKVVAQSMASKAGPEKLR
jgi:hypothetical protein